MFHLGKCENGRATNCADHAHNKMSPPSSRHPTENDDQKDIMLEKSSSNLTIGVISIWFCIWSMSSDYKAMIEHWNGWSRISANG